MMASSELTSEQKALLSKVGEAHNNPWVFLSNFWFTLDEHDPRSLFKKYPGKGYQRVLVRALNNYNVIFIKKSRQIMLTHTVAGFLCWDAAYKKNRKHFIQSKKDEDAADVLERIRFGYERLRDMGFPGLPDAKMTGDKTGTKKTLQFKSNQCIMRAIPMGENIIRMHTSSKIFSDEINHQQKGDEAYGAAAPTLFGGGQFIGAGTSNGKNWVYRLMHNIDEQTGDKIGENVVDSRRVIRPMFQPDAGLSEENQRYQIERWILSLSDEEFNSIPFEELVACCPGIDFWVTAPKKGTDLGIACMWIHYSADPAKDTRTQAGRHWYRHAKATMTETKWAREMEGNDDIYEGRPVVPNWNRDVFVRAFDYDPSSGVRLSVDFGSDVCCTFFGQVHRIEGSTRKQLRIIDEVHIDDSTASTPNLAMRMREKMETQYRYAWDSGNHMCHPDPAGHQRRETTSDKSQRTSIDILKAHGFKITTKKLGIPESTELVRNVFQTFYETKDGKSVPAILIHPRCEYAIGVFGGGWHYPDEDDGGKPEKDGVWDHGGDCARHLVSAVFDGRDFGVRDAAPVRRDKIIRNRYTGRVVRRIPVRC